MRSVSERRRKKQGGQEIFEFALAALFLMPMFLGSFIVGMNLIRSIQCNQVARDLDAMFIQGADFSTLPLQQEAQRLAQGLNLQISAFTGDASGHEQSNTGNAGNGLVTVTQIMWIGGPTSTSCLNVGGAGKCTNQSSFVFVQQLQFGKGSLANPSTVSVGQCPLAIMNTAGVVTGYVTDARAALAGSAQTNMQSLWTLSAEVHGGTATALSDQQVVYIVEAYFQSPDLSVGALSGNGIYARYFF